MRKTVIIVCMCGWFVLAGADTGALDQSVAGVSARAVGLGQAVGSMSGDPAHFIYNPALLGPTVRPQTFLLSTKTLQEVSYLNGGFTVPVDGVGVFGLAVLNRNVVKVPLTDDFAADATEIDYAQIDYARYDENTYILGYGQPLTIWDRPFSWGLSTKVFQRSTTKVHDGTASGFNLDAGVVMDVIPEVTVGLAYKNLLRGYKAGAGALLWGTGETESMDSYLDLGISSARLQKNVYVGLDFIKNMSRTAYPINVRFGVEWHPVDVLFVRGGVQQQYVASDSDNDDKMYAQNVYSIGLGLNLFGWRMDYAYRPDTEIQDLSSHWISLSWVGAEPALAEPSSVAQTPSADHAVSADETVTEASLVLLCPENRTVTTARQIVVAGTITDERYAVINGQDYPLTKNNLFSVAMPLTIGLNDIAVTTPLKKTTIALKVLRLADFADIQDSPYKDAVVTLATLGYMSGDYPDRFNPRREVSRAEMATVIVRLQRLTTPVQLRAIMDSVDMLSAQGLLKGYPDGLMRPEERLTNGQLAMVLARLQNLPYKAGGRTLGYLAQDHWSEQAVDALVETKQYTREDFAPRSAAVTREKLAYLLSRLPVVQESAARMNNFETFVAPEQSAVFFMQKPGAVNTQSDEELFNQLIENDVGKAIPPPIDQTEMLLSRMQKATANAVLKKTAPPDRQKYVLLRSKGLIGNQPPDHQVTQQELAVILKKLYGLVVDNPRQETVSRAYAIALIVRAEKLPLQAVTTPPYKDVELKNWASRQICAAKAKGILPKTEYLKPFQAIDMQTLAEYLANTPTVKKKL